MQPRWPRKNPTDERWIRFASSCARLPPGLDRGLLLPARIRIERRDGAGGLSCLGPQILRIHDAVVIHDEGHDAGVAVLDREGDQREAAEHLALDEVVVSTACSARPLRCQQSVDVAAISLAGGNAFLEVALAARPCELIAERTRQLVAGGRPVQAVLVAFGARQLLRILQQRLPLRIASVVLALGIHERRARLDRVALVLADPAIDDLVRAGGAVEAPTI